MIIIGEKADRFVVHWDERRGSALADLAGFWSLEDLGAFAGVMTDAIARSRARHGGARLMVDTTKSQVMAGNVFGQVQGGGFPELDARDRVATIVASALIRMQLSRHTVVTPVQTAFFTSRDDADTWLHMKKSAVA